MKRKTEEERRYYLLTKLHWAMGACAAEEAEDEAGDCVLVYPIDGLVKALNKGERITDAYKLVTLLREFQIHPVTVYARDKDDVDIPIRGFLSSDLRQDLFGRYEEFYDRDEEAIWGETPYL